MKKGIKILHVMPQIGVGGAERQLLELITHSDPERVCHEVFFYDDARDRVMLQKYHDSGILLRRIPRNKRNPAGFLWTFAKAIRESRPDIVHCWLVSGNFWGRLAAVLAGVRHIVVAWRNCDLWKPWGMRVCEWLAPGRVRHLANSRAAAEFISQKLWISLRRFTVIYNGLEVERFRIPNPGRKPFAGLDIPEDCKIVTMVGRLMAQKNYPMLIRVAQKAKVSGLSAHFVIVGDGVQLDYLKQLTEQMDVKESVHFAGVRSDIPNILTGSDIFLFTSNYEGFPNALLEAMAAGLPVVTTDFGGVRELVTGPEVGTVVPRDDVQAAFDAIKFYLANPEVAAKSGQNANNLVHSNYDTSKMVEKTISFYMEFLSDA